MYFYVLYFLHRVIVQSLLEGIQEAKQQAITTLGENVFMYVILHSYS